MGRRAERTNANSRGPPRVLSPGNLSRQLPALMVCLHWTRTNTKTGEGPWIYTKRRIPWSVTRPTAYRDQVEETAVEELRRGVSTQTTPPRNKNERFELEQTGIYLNGGNLGPGPSHTNTCVTTIGSFPRFDWRGLPSPVIVASRQPLVSQLPCFSHLPRRLTGHPARPILGRDFVPVRSRPG